MDENGISDVEARIGRSAPPQYCVELSLIVFDNISKTSAHRAQKRQLGERLGRLVELGALVAVTGDHGLSHKARATLKETEN
ncbi:hypothetical protein ACO22_02283 [Paracoccidioides brasiliensis]|uniref:Uncharacterized protein n=1 Tax=Paracoccidioides brasiliensis TaxID=121759 RepID=A0A1D2JJ20_PARBR|nr:hypothetical protein ACO22_02283 [Paracoccidioides brasiliensis]